MKPFVIACTGIGFLYSISLSAQDFKLTNDKLEAVGVVISLETLDKKSVVKVSKDPAMMSADEPTYVKLKGTDFKDGTIEVSVLSRLLPTAPETARGFIGVAFRANGDNSKFECIYIRPT